MGRFDELGNGFGLHGFDPHSRWDGPLVTRGVLRDPVRGWHHAVHDEPQRYQQHPPPPPPPPPRPMREHGGFSNYAGGGTRDRDRDREREYFAREQDYGYERNGYGGPGYGDPGWSPTTNRYPHEEPHYAPQQQQPQHHGYGYGYGYGAHGSDMGIGERLSDDRGPFYGRGPKGYKRSDERIREEVCEMIARQGYVDASDVEVTVENGVVCLVGTVAQRQDKRSLEQMADRVYGVEEVRNELRLQQMRQPPQPPQQMPQMPTTQMQPQPVPQQVQIQPPQSQPNNGKNGRLA